MKPILRMLGITQELYGAGLLEQIIYYRTINVKDLTYKQVEEILYAWETRNYVSLKLLREGCVDRVSPVMSKEYVELGLCTQEEYDRDYVNMIVKYLHTIY